MLLDQAMRTSGSALFRWRSFVLMIFLPLIFLAVRKAEPVERMIGEFWGDTFEMACIGLVIAGLALRAVTAGFVPARTSGRNTNRQVAAALNTTGLYSLTRNPLYLANCLTYLGIVLFTQDLLLTLAFALFLMVYYERIILAEETFLLDRFGDAYGDWAAEVPAFLPRFSGWKPPDLRFSLRTVIRREYPGWFAAVLSLGLIKIAQDAFGGKHEGSIDSAWLLTICAAAALYLAVHFVKRRTGLLGVPGR